jgi:hypothetical protein
MPSTDRAAGENPLANPFFRYSVDPKRHVKIDGTTNPEPRAR